MRTFKVTAVVEVEAEDLEAAREYAKRMLRAADIPVHALCAAVGDESVSAFSWNVEVLPPPQPPCPWCGAPQDGNGRTWCYNCGIRIGQQAK